MNCSTTSTPRLARSSKARFGCRRILVAVALLAGLASTKLSAADPFETPAELTLAEARRQAFLNNWDLLAAKAEVEIAQAQKLVAREFPNPTLSLSSSKIKTSQGNGTILGNSLSERSYDSIAAVNQLIEIGGKRASRRASAAAGLAAAVARFRDVQRLLDVGIVRVYVAALQAEANAQILNRSAATLRQEADIAVVRQKAGDISTSDQAQIEVAAARFEQDAKNAAAAAVANRIALDTVLGSRHPTGEWHAVDSLETVAQTLLGITNQPPLASIERRPDVIAAEHNRRRAEADWRLQKAMRIPDPTVTFQYEREPPDTRNSVGIGLAFPLPLWNRNQGNITAADAARKQAALEVERTRAQALADVLNARTAYEDAAGRFARYQVEIVPKSAKVRESIAFAYQKGGVALLDLLSAERTDNEVRLATAQAASDAANAAALLRAAVSADENIFTP